MDKGEEEGEVQDGTKAQLSSKKKKRCPASTKTNKLLLMRKSKQQQQQLLSQRLRAVKPNPKKPETCQRLESSTKKSKDLPRTVFLLLLSSSTFHFNFQSPLIYCLIPSIFTSFSTFSQFVLLNQCNCPQINPTNREREREREKALLCFCF